MAAAASRSFSDASNAWEHHPWRHGECELPPQPLSRIASRSIPPSSISARLQLLVDIMGADRVMLGSDYPFPLGEDHIGGLIRAAIFRRERKENAGRKCRWISGTRRAQGRSVRRRRSESPSMPVRTCTQSQAHLQLVFQSSRAAELQHPQSSPPASRRIAVHHRSSDL